MIQETSRYRVMGALALSALALAGMPLLAEVGSADDRGDLVTVSVSSAGVDLLPNRDYHRAILTLSGGDRVLRYTFGPEDQLAISMFNPEGELLPDGQYNWELKFEPDAAGRAALMIEASRNDGYAPSALKPQTGVFRVVDGFIADPDLAESPYVRTEPREVTVDSFLPSHHGVDERAEASSSARDSDEAVEAGAVETRSETASTETESGRAADSDLAAAGEGADDNQE